MLIRIMIMMANFSEHPEMSSSDMLHKFRDYMDSYDQLRLVRMMTIMRTILMMMVMIFMVRVSADAAQLLATKFSSSTCGSGFTYTAGIKLWYILYFNSF